MPVQFSEIENRHQMVLHAAQGMKQFYLLALKEGLWDAVKSDCGERLVAISILHLSYRGEKPSLITDSSNKQKSWIQEPFTKYRALMCTLTGESSTQIQLI